ncbi:phage tail tape measure protein [Crateriforma conspicua]|uniref:Phage-related minor tail protein n=1 Tax=Crateriforma conspicua TaxID=2527996 RepID=A0A5C5XZH6_9PLAN|nr:hypothetical protein [Crateriforma conspicua]TWT68400.1 hypothetical protein Pan14r_06450 [Crateriforma conspicua]
MSTASVRAGKAFVEISARDKTQKVMKDLERRLKGFGGSIASMGSKMAAVGAAGAAALFVPSIKAASDLEETMNKFNTVFGDSAGEMKKWGDAYAKEVGRSKEQVASFLAGTQDLLKPMGFAGDEAGQMSQQISKLAVDLASFNNMADADTLRDLHAALTGSGEVMKKYGVIVSEAAVKQELLNTGFDPKAATETQKATARLAIIMRGTTDAQGDAIKSSGSFANQMKRLQAISIDLGAAIGKAVLPTITWVVSKMGDAAQVVTDFVAKNQKIVKVAGAAVFALTGLGTGLVTLGGIATMAGIAIGGVSTAITLIGGIISSPLLIVGGILAGVTAGVVALGAAFIYYSGVGGDAIQLVKDGFKGLLSVGKQTLGGITSALMSGNIKDAAKILWAGVRVVFWRGTEKTLYAVIQMATKIRNTLKDVAVWIVQRFTNAFVSISKAIEKAKNFSFSAASETIAAAMGDINTKLSFKGEGSLRKRGDRAQAELDALTAKYKSKEAAPETEEEEDGDISKDKLKAMLQGMAARYNKLQAQMKAMMAQADADAMAKAAEGFGGHGSADINTPAVSAGAADAIDQAAGGSGSSIGGTTSSAAAALIGFSGDKVGERLVSLTEESISTLQSIDENIRVSDIGAGVTIA